MALPRPTSTLAARTAVFMLVAGLLALMPMARAGASATHQCRETLPTGSYDHVRVGEGESCIFEEGVTIRGNLKAKNPVDVVTSGATIHGNVTIDGATGNVVINSGPVPGSTSHIYGNVTVRNTDQTPIPPDADDLDFLGVYVGGEFLGTGFPEPPFVFSTLHIHGDLVLKNNMVFDFFAGNLFAEQIIDGNVEVRGNVLSDLDLHVYTMNVGGNLTVRSNTAQAFTSVICNDVAGNLVIDDNFNPGVDPGFGPTPGAVWAQLQVVTSCPELPIGDSAVGGNMSIRKNTVGDGNNDFAVISVVEATVLGNVDLRKNELDAVDLSASSFFTVESTYVGGNLTCRKNSIDPTEDFFGTGPNVVVGDDKCFGDE